MWKRELIAVMHQNVCRREILIPAMDKLNEIEQEALARLIKEIESSSRREGERSIYRNHGKFMGRM